jgi:transcriptional regulator with PAS, ATPase and Fis domain
MKKNRIVGGVEEQGELICELPGCGEVEFAETENSSDEALDHANSKSTASHAGHGLKSMSTFQGMVGHSSALLRVLELALRAARTNCTILVQGETGTGKELLARGIHANSNRASKAFVTLNCGAIPRELFESELFGHVQGSFTGAVRNRTGKAEAANTGTLFLDEIGEMPLDLQVKLLRLIQGGEIERVGSAMPTKLDIRIIAATNRNLPFLVKKGKFREDLYHRLNVITLQLPNLRDRAEDIPELVQYFFQRSCAKHQRDDLSLSLPVLKRFAEYPWPGNIREVENAIERIVVLTPGKEVSLNDLPSDLQSEAAPLERIGLILPSKGVSLREIEKELFREALKRNNWNRSRAARYLGVTRDTLNYRMRKFGLDRAKAGRLALGVVEKSPGIALVH